MYYLKIDSETNANSIPSTIIPVNDGILYLNQYVNANEEPDVVIPQLHFYSQKNGAVCDEIIATNPNVVSLTNTAANINCNCDLGSIFNATVPLTTSTATIQILRYPAILGYGILVRFYVSTNVTVKYLSNKTMFTTNTGSDYSEGCYYASFMYISPSVGLKLVNFFKEP